MTQNIINNKECGTIDNKTVETPGMIFVLINAIILEYLY